MSRPGGRAPLVTLTALGLLLGAGPPGAAQEETAAQPRIASVSAGFGGRAISGRPVPVRVVLEGPPGTASEVRVLAVSGEVSAERRLALPAGARQRLELALVCGTELAVELLGPGGRRLDRRELEQELLDPQTGLLLLDGHDAQAEPRASGEGGLLVVTEPAREAPTEVACYAPFGAVALRAPDLAELSSEQWDALAGYLAQGGTLLALAGGPGAPPLEPVVRRLGVRELLPGRLLEQSVRIGRVGLGGVVWFPVDVVELAKGEGYGALRLRAKLATLVTRQLRRDRFPVLFARQGGVAVLQGPAATTQLLLAGFFALYLLLAGPVLGFVFRQAPRRRLALAALGLVAGGVLLAPLVAALVRGGGGQALSRSVIYVPPQGTAAELGVVTVLSGGADRYRIQLRGSEGLSATRIPTNVNPEQVWSNNGEVLQRPRPDTLRTWRGGAASVEVPLSMPLWSRQSVVTSCLRPELRSLSAELEELPGGGSRLTLVNRGRQPFPNAILIAPGGENEFLNPWAPWLELPSLEPGERRVIELPGHRSLPYREGWQEVLEVPAGWTDWVQIGRPSNVLSGGQAAPYWIVSPAQASVEVGGEHLTALSQAVRIDPVVLVVEQPVWLGIEVAESSGPLGDERPRVVPGVEVVGVAEGGPAGRAGLQVGDILSAVDGVPLGTVTDLRAVLTSLRPGDKVELRVLPVGDRGAPRTVLCTLSEPPVEGGRR